VPDMVKEVVIVGGGTAGWLCAAYLGRTLAASAPGGAKITLVESADIGILGVGEGTFPAIKNILMAVGIDEAHFLKESSATFKQGTRFNHWQVAPGQPGRDHYFHAFHSQQQRGELDLLPYWLLGCAGPGVYWDEAITLQKRTADAHRAPKQIRDGNYAGPMNYAYHFDAVRFAHLLRSVATQLGIHHIVDTVEAVHLDETGAIASLKTRDHGALTADLYIDCSGFQARLIGKALNVPFKSCHDWLFCDRAVAMQVPNARPDTPIASYTISTAQEAGWTWDIGLDNRRGIGHVYSSAHMSDEKAEQVLRDYVGPAAVDKAVRSFKFDAGYRTTPWVKNCVAVGVAGGFLEPLEATGIMFVEVAAILIGKFFPWAGEVETAARQFNHIMARRYERVVDFLKVHYCLTKRTDTAFWRDSTDPASIPDSLKELLDRWRFRPPEFMDFEMRYETFTEANWQFTLYGMGYKTDLSAKAGVFVYHDHARQQFQDIRRQGDVAMTMLPTNRDLIAQVYKHGFQPKVTQGVQVAPVQTRRS
jgi:tryptophan halogenase